LEKKPVDFDAFLATMKALGYEVSLLIDIQERLQAGKGAGYER